VKRQWSSSDSNSYTLLSPVFRAC